MVEGWPAPAVLLSGNHEQVREWRLKQSLGRTWERRPELLSGRRMNETERRLLAEYQAGNRSSCQGGADSKRTSDNTKIRDANDEQHH